MNKKQILTLILNNPQFVDWALVDSKQEPIVGVDLKTFMTTDHRQALMLVDKAGEPCPVIWEWDTSNKLRGYGVPCVDIMSGCVFTIPAEL